MVKAHAIGVIQARLSSTRLPGKILAPVAGRTPLLDVLVQRLERTGIEWRLATTIAKADDVTAAWGEALGLRVFRGSEDDVLSRFLGALSEDDPEWCVRVTADNPFTSARTVRALLNQATGVDRSVASIRTVSQPRVYPLGFAPEVARVEALRRLNDSIPVTESFHRAHVTSAIDEQAISRLRDEKAPRRPHWRWTIDTEADLRMARAAFSLFGPGWSTIEYAAMVRVLDDHPEVTSLNNHVIQKSLTDG
jgi:spore coat polysaccharide biosynthesis protein SpsF